MCCMCKGARLMLTDKQIHEVQADKPTFSAKFIRNFDDEWERAVRKIKRKVRWVKKDA